MSERQVNTTTYKLGWLSLFNDLTNDIITPLLPLYLASFGIGASFLGLMEGLANALSHITVLFSSWYANRTGHLKKTTVFGYSLSALARPFLAIPIPAIILIARLSDRIGKGIRTAPRDTLITVSNEKKSWEKSFGVQRSMDHLGALIAPPLAAWLLAAYNLSLPILFLIACVPSLVSIIVIPKKIRFSDSPPKQKVSFLSWKHLDKPLKRYFLIIFLSALTTPSELFLILKMKTLGLKNSEAPLAWFVLTLFTFAAVGLGGFLAERWSRRRTIALGWLLFALVFLGFAYNTDLKWAWLLVAAYGLHAGLIEVAERTYPARLAKAEHQGLALGWYSFSYGMGLLPASLLFGIFWDHFGAKTAFLVNTVGSILVIFALLLLPSDRQKKPFNQKST